MLLDVSLVVLKMDLVFLKTSLVFSWGSSSVPPGSAIYGTKIHTAKTSDFWYIEEEEVQERPDKYIDIEQSLDYEWGATGRSMIRT